MRSEIAESLRYGVTIVAGLSVDLAVANGTASLPGVALPVASVIGLGAGAAVNYLLLNLWAFRGAKRYSVISRVMRYLMTLAVTAAVRAGAVLVLGVLIPQAAPLFILMAATALSFLVNYAVSRRFVFRRAKETASASS